MKKTLAFLLSLFTAMVMIFCVPMSDSDVEADVVCTPLQKKIQEVAAEMRGLTKPQLNSKYNAGIPNTNWCGYYTDLVLKQAFKRLGYEDFGNYYPTQDLFGSVTVSRYVENDTRWAEKYTWNDWSYSGKSGYKTNNISSYVPRIGDVITIDTSNGKGNPDPDHVAIIVRVIDQNSYVTSEGNTGSKQSLDSRTVKEFTYSRTNSSSAFYGPCGKVVCALRPHDPTGSVISSGTPWDNGDFYAYIILKDGWKHTGVSEDNNLRILNNDSADTKQIFHCVPAGGGEYVIFNEYNGYCIDVYDNGVSSGTNIGLYPCHNGTNQRWYIYQTPNGYILRPKHCDLVMASVGGNIELAVLTADCSQLFSVYPLENDNTHYVKPNPPKSTVLSASASCVSINDNISFSWEPIPVTSKYDQRKYYLDVFNSQCEWRYTYELGSDVTQINGSFDETGLFYWRIRTANVKYKDYWSTSNVVSVEVVDNVIIFAEANVIDVPDFPITGPGDYTLQAVDWHSMVDMEPLTPVATITTVAVPTATPKPTATTSPKATSTPKPVATTSPRVMATPKPVVTTTPTVTSRPEVNEFVERLYGVALSRKSDDEGMNYWVDQVKKSGMTGGDLAKSFLFSDEFLCKNVSDENFVETLYNTFFDRDSEADGKTYWVNQLQCGTMDKKTVIEGFINSDEWNNLCASYGIASGGTSKSFVNIEPNEQVVAFATRLYTTCLGREPEADGLKYWSEELSNLRVSGTKVALGFFFSDEFVGKNLSNEEYVRRLYLTFMDRDCDQDGFNYWVCQLNSGATRVDVFNGFSCSTEFDNICTSYGIYR